MSYCLLPPTRFSATNATARPSHPSGTPWLISNATRCCRVFCTTSGEPEAEAVATEVSTTTPPEVRALLADEVRVTQLRSGVTVARPRTAVLSHELGGGGRCRGGVFAAVVVEAQVFDLTRVDAAGVVAAGGGAFAPMSCTAYTNA